MDRKKDIVFDVGRVLIDFSYEALFAFFNEKGLFLKNLQEFIEKTELSAYEYGDISSDDFIATLLTLFSQPIDRSVLISKWTEIFSPNIEMLAYAFALKRSHRVFLLSNTSALHWEYLLSEYELNIWASGVLASFEVGAMKPEAKIFQKAEEHFDLFPENTVFIDDINENVLGAISCGWHGIHHVGIEKTKTMLDAWISK